MADKSWSTDSVQGAERFAYWHDAVSEAVLNVTARNPLGNRFAGDITCNEFDDLRFAAFTSTPHQIIRTRGHIGRSRGEHYLVSVQRLGSSLMSQADRVAELAPGHIGILDGMRPFTVAFPGNVDRIVAAIPHRLLRPRAPWLEAVPLRTLPAPSPLVDVCKVYIERLSAAQSGSVREFWLLAENLCNLLALLTAPGETERQSLRRVTRQAELDHMLAYLRANLADPGLSPRVLADRMGVSIRTVHNRFEEAGLTFGKWVSEHRLLACHKVLSDPAFGGLNVSEIAFKWGFNDLSHFTKAFRARFAMTPTACRKSRPTP
jgi:AraC family transcriptional activator of tynA and feaB